MPIVKVSRKISYLALAASAIAVPGVASAQSSALDTPEAVLPYEFPADRVTVSNRFRPEFESSGILVGGMTVRPSLAGGVSYTDNVFSVRENAEKDGFVQLNPSIAIHTTGQATGGNVQIQLSGALRRFFDEKAANETGLSGQAVGALPIGVNSMLTGGAIVKRVYERQDSGSFPADSLAPIKYDEFVGFTRFRTEGSRIRLTAGLDVTTTNFSAAKVALSDLRISQDYRDRTVIRGSGRLEASVTGATSAFLEARYQKIDYTQDLIGGLIPNRDGKQADILAGAMIDSGKLRGALAAGYTRRMFDSPLYEDFGGLAVNGELTYFASGLTTFTLAAYRSIAESGNTSNSGQFGTGGSLTVDHELLRYVILSGRVGYEQNKYRGIDRSDDILSLSGQVRYLANRHFEINGEVIYLKRTSEGVSIGPEFDKLQFGINVVGKI